MLRTPTIFAHTLALATLATACGDDRAATADTATNADAAEVSADGTGDAAVETTPETTAVCDPVAQTGCKATENCTYLSADHAPRCVEEGAIAAGEACDSDNRCKRGVCLSLNDTAELCYQFCAASTDCGGKMCLELTNAPYKLCEIDGIYQDCSLLAQDCTDNKACFSIKDHETGICLPPGTTETGGACTTADACKKGDICINDACHTICDPKLTAPCGETAQCNTYKDAGYCQPK
jgi:hypothetical protein